MSRPLTATFARFQACMNYGAIIKGNKKRRGSTKATAFRIRTRASRKAEKVEAEKDNTVEEILDADLTEALGACMAEEGFGGAAADLGGAVAKDAAFDVGGLPWGGFA